MKLLWPESQKRVLLEMREHRFRVGRITGRRGRVGGIRGRGSGRSSSGVRLLRPCASSGEAQPQGQQKRQGERAASGMPAAGPEAREQAG
jgi:hypothetical protein